jgi:hypothetical protein
MADPPKRLCLSYLRVAKRLGWLRRRYQKRCYQKRIEPLPTLGRTDLPFTAALRARLRARFQSIGR